MYIREVALFIKYVKIINNNWYARFSQIRFLYMCSSVSLKIIHRFRIEIWRKNVWMYDKYEVVTTLI